MGNFSGVGQAPLYESGTFFLPGNYELSISRVLVKNTMKSGRCFIVEFAIEKSDNESMPAGSMGTWLQKLDNTVIAYPSLKAFTLAVVGVDKNDKEAVEAESPNVEKLLDAAVDDGALNGMKVRLRAERTKTQKGADFTRHTWLPV